MAMAPNKRFIYAQLRGKPYPVSTFTIDHTSGKLTLVDTMPLVDQMAYINTDRSGKYLLAASYVGAKLCIYPIDPKTGIVGPKATQLLDTKPKAHCVYVGAANHIYVPVLGGDEVLELNLAADGTVTPNGPGAVHTKQGAGPRHFTIHPNGRWAYLITETTATIGQYNVDPATGQLTEVGFVDTGDYKEQPAASDIHVTPNGRFLYGAERKTSMLHGFKIDEKNGKLTKIGSFPTEKTPRGFNIDPRGKFLLAVGMDSASMTVYEIAADGRLGPLKQYPMGTNPNWVEIVDLA
jgi:6-phosphogluconolactonase